MGQRWFTACGYDTESSTICISNVKRKKSNKVNDSLDMCSYRLIQNYAVNKRSEFAASSALNISTDFDISDPDGNGYFLDQSNDECALINMEDTLDICNYRRPTGKNLTRILNAKEALVCRGMIAEISFNKSTTDNSHLNEISKSKAAMEDTLDVCNYRRSLAAQSLTPVRCNPWTSNYFNKCVVPFALFSPSPIPMASSSITNRSSFVAQFSDQSDETIDLSV